MHGRVKVRTSEEEKARKEKERQEKLKVFKYAMQKIQMKRKQEELDKEMLDITGKVLSSNPDIYTLWNIRRETIIQLRTNNDDGEEVTKLHDDELQLTEYCLKINPKSYCAWHQREWVLTTRNDPDWKKELNLCNTYLKLDERNFHTWDYRRFVVKQCKPPLEEEFNFTTEKIYDNFSNYSAWHYRSKMLVELYPDLEGGRPIEDSHHKHELKMVQSAAFTDPDDTSAWFYQKWLLGAVKRTIIPVVCTITQSKTTVAFNQHVSLDFVESKTCIYINDVLIQGKWESCTGNAHDNLWTLKHDTTISDDLVVKIEFLTEDGGKQILVCDKVETCTYIAKNEINFQLQYSKPVIEELNNQLVACRQLLDMEPDNKWTLLTTTVFLHCIDAKHHQEAIKNLKTLKTIDKMRSGYYDDLITKWSIEDQLLTDYKNAETVYRVKFDETITSLPHLQYYSFCQEVNLANQKLTSNILPSLIVLQHCKKLNLENNHFKTLKGFPVLDLEHLDLRGNKDLDKNEVDIFQKNCKYEVDF